MAKRFTDTELWQKAWFQDLEPENKLLVLYIFQNCDASGVWNINYKLASFIIGFSIDEQNIKAINAKNKLFEFFDNDKIFVIDFIKFQYGTLSENCKPHKPIIEKLKKYGLYERVSKGYPKGIDTLSDTLEEKEKEKEKEKEQYKEKEKEIRDPYINSLNTYFCEEYRKVFGNKLKVFLSNQNQLRLKELAAQYPDIRELIPQALQKLKSIDFKDIDFTPTASWLLKGDNFERVMNGEFAPKEKEKTWRELLAEKAAKRGIDINAECT